MGLQILRGIEIEARVDRCKFLIMIVYLNVSPVARGKKHLSASFHQVSPKNINFDKPYKQVTGSPAEVTTKVIHELDSSRTPVRFFHFSPDLPPDASSIMHRAMMAYLRANLPVQRGLLKVSCSKEKAGNIVNVLYYSSIKYEESGLEPAGFSGPLMEIARKVFQTLDEGYRHPVVLQFEGKVPDEVRELFLNIVSIYNKQLSWG